MAKQGGKPDKRRIEQYQHADKKRANNPPVGLVTTHTDPPEPPRKTYRHDPHLPPELVWAGKAERASFELPVVSLHVHERIDPKTIVEAVRTNGHPARRPDALAQQSLFESPAENPPLRDALDFYRHPHGWTNRLVAGDSLLVMNSLLEKEGLAGKVQMVYIDPPYGIRYGSNFQPFTNRRDVKDGRDEDLTQEPETIKAFRDTWELGIHSYLTYLRDRLLLARELLHDSGSVFVQISDENVHLVRNILDAVFGSEGFCALIPFTKGAAGLEAADRLAARLDYIVWYDKDGESRKYRQLYVPRSEASQSTYGWIELSDGSRRRLDAEERSGRTAIPDGARLFADIDLTKPGPGAKYGIEFQGRTYESGGRWWGTPKESLERVIAAGMVIAVGNKLRLVRYADDFPYSSISNLWAGFAGQKNPVYVVQTNVEIVQRCLLMTTDPGDLVFDPTCGSGTTAYVAEQWGRRWMTCDTSRVAIALAKQRLMTATFDYYRLSHPDEGVASGFVYKTVPHVTLKSIANNPDLRSGMTRAEIDAAIRRHADRETLYDQPEADRGKARVTGPFTVEAVPAVAVRPVETVLESWNTTIEAQPPLPAVGPLDGQERLTFRESTTIARYGETARQTEWRDELLRGGVRGKSGQRLAFARLEPLSATRHLHAVGETLPAAAATAKAPAKKGPAKKGAGGREAGKPAADTEEVRRVAVSFGPEHAPLEQRQVELAWEEARTLRPKPDVLLFAAFHFDPEAAKDIDDLAPEKTGMTFLRAQMNTDLLTDDLKKKRASNESFWLIGQPEVALRQIAKGEHKGLWEVEVLGFDYYNPASGQIESGDTRKIAMWLLDTDYDGRSLFPRQVFFPMAGEKDGWGRLAKDLKAEIDEERIEAYRGVKSLPFAAAAHGRIGVKIVDDRGIESLKVMDLE